MTQSAQALQPNGVLFHPSFPDLWQVTAAAPALGIQAQRQPPLHADRPTRSTATDGGPLLQPGQVIKGRAHGAAWIQTEEGYLPRWTSDPEGAVVEQFLVQPYWPTYRVVGHAQVGTRGVAPYVLEDTEGTKKSPATAGTLLRLPDELPGEYDATSPLVDAELTKIPGHVFETAEQPIVGPDGSTLAVTDSNWWTSDGRVWWPKTVPLLVPVLGWSLPSLVPPTVVTEWAAPMTSAFLKTAFGHGRGAVIVALILTEYVMIVIGALSGVALGWSAGLQFVYAAFLVLLVGVEMAVVAYMIPNGPFWLSMNAMKLPFCVVKSVLWRWDLYSDVGFAILAYQERDRISALLWVYSAVFSALVIGGRLIYTFVYVKRIVKDVDETSLAQVSVPSFLLVFQLLCQTMSADEGREARRLSAKTNLAFELLRTLCEDLPEICIQAAYLFGQDAPPNCTSCAYGFVFISFVVSIATSLPGLLRLVKGYQRYRNVTLEISADEEKTRD
jgi:hypothetical protein